MGNPSFPHFSHLTLVTCVSLNFKLRFLALCVFVCVRFSFCVRMFFFVFFGRSLNSSAIWLKIKNLIDAQYLFITICMGLKKIMCVFVSHLFKFNPLWTLISKFNPLCVSNPRTTWQPLTLVTVPVRMTSLGM